MNEKLINALDEIQDQHIQEAAKPKKKKKVWIIRFSAMAAMVAVLLGIVFIPRPIAASATVSLPGDARSNGDWKLCKETATQLSDFFAAGSAQFLNGEENSLWSPVNAFIGLAMAAELAQGESRQQILDLFGVEDLETLRRYCSNLWEYIYKDDGREICTLANSLWLNANFQYDQQTMDDLAYYHYASVYKGEMGSKQMNSNIATWLDDHTGGLLKKYTSDIRTSPDTVFALYSTIYVQSKWSDEFSKSNNTEDVFHGPNGDTTVTFMNKRESMLYYWADDFGAVRMTMKNGCSMWFILPDEGTSISRLLEDGTYMQMITGTWEQIDTYKVNLSVPKFDISSDLDLKQGLQEMGVTDMFDINRANFSALTGDTPIYASKVRQKARLEIDEEGVKAAVYFEMQADNGAAPPSEEKVIDFILNRPFLCVLSSGTVPLFVGTVNAP